MQTFIQIQIIIFFYIYYKNTTSYVNIIKGDSLSTKNKYNMLTKIKC